MRDLSPGNGVPLRARAARDSSRGVLVGCIASRSCILLGVFAMVPEMSAVPTPGRWMARGNRSATPKRSAWVLYTKYLVPFEVVSVVLLVAMIGAIIFGRQRRRSGA